MKRGDGNGEAYTLDVFWRHLAASRVRGIKVVDGLAHVAVGREHDRFQALVGAHHILAIVTIPHITRHHREACSQSHNA